MDYRKNQTFIDSVQNGECALRAEQKLSFMTCKISCFLTNMNSRHSCYGWVFFPSTVLEGHSLSKAQEELYECFVFKKADCFPPKSRSRHWYLTYILGQFCTERQKSKYIVTASTVVAFLGLLSLFFFFLFWLLLLRTPPPPSSRVNCSLELQTDERGRMIFYCSKRVIFFPKWKQCDIFMLYALEAMCNFVEFRDTGFNGPSFYSIYVWSRRCEMMPLSTSKEIRNVRTYKYYNCVYCKEKKPGSVFLTDEKVIQWSRFSQRNWFFFLENFCLWEQKWPQLFIANLDLLMLDGAFGLDL